MESLRLIPNFNGTPPPLKVQNVLAHSFGILYENYSPHVRGCMRRSSHVLCDQHKIFFEQIANFTNQLCLLRDILKKIIVSCTGHKKNDSLAEIVLMLSNIFC